MKAKFYDQNRDKKWYPTIELDLCEVFDEYLSSMDGYEVEQFIEKWLGHKKFLELATKYMIEAYSSYNTDTDTTDARARLLEALTDNRVNAVAGKAASAMTEKWYYEGQYWQMYHGIGRFLSDNMSADEMRRWNVFFSRFKEENPAPAIGSAEWTEYRNKAHADVVASIQKAIAKTDGDVA